MRTIKAKVPVGYKKVKMWGREAVAVWDPISGWADQGRVIYASYPGGAYIDLSFGRPGKPTEVINIYNYETGKPEVIIEDASTLRRVVKEWADGQDAEAKEWAEQNDEPVYDWFGSYIENARY